MSRHSSDVFEEIEFFARQAKEESREGLFEIAKLTMTRIATLTEEARSRLRRESDYKSAAEHCLQPTFDSTGEKPAISKSYSSASPDKSG